MQRETCLCSIARSGYYDAPVLTLDSTIDPMGVPMEGFETLSGLYVPDFHCFIMGSRNDLFPAGTHYCAVDPISMPLEGLEAPAGLDIPYFHCFIVRSGNYELPVGAERYTIDFSSMPLEGFEVSA